MGQKANGYQFVSENIVCKQEVKYQSNGASLMSDTRKSISNTYLLRYLQYKVKQRLRRKSFGAQQSQSEPKLILRTPQTLNCLERACFLSRHFKIQFIFSRFLQIFQHGYQHWQHDNIVEIIIKTAPVTSRIAQTIAISAFIETKLEEIFSVLLLSAV